MRIAFETTATLLLLVIKQSVVVVAQNPNFANCDASTLYYSSLPADTTTWTRDQLHDLVMSTHTGTVEQSGNPVGSNDVWEALMDLDPGSAAGSVLLAYSLEEVPAEPFSGTFWNKEFVWPVSRGIGATGKDATDLHNIRPVMGSPTKLERGNKFMGECNILNHGGDCEAPAQGGAETSCSCNRAYQPPVEQRGMVARTLMYMDLRYDGDVDDESDLQLTDCPFNPPNEMAYKSQLLQWHLDNPPTEAEIARNDLVCSEFQGNRNPFVDHFDLAQQIYGTPLAVPGDTPENYAACASIPTEAPTGAPNDCDIIEVGSIYFYIILSDDPDALGLFPFEDIPGNVDLYLTTNAWNGTGFLDNEGTVKYTAPPDGIAGGVYFGYGDGSPNQVEWDTIDKFGNITLDDDNFTLSDEGDMVFLYCMGNGDVVRPLAAISYNGNFSEAGLASYGKNESALPDTLVKDGTIILPHSDNWYYAGPTSLEASQLKASMRDISLWDSSIERPTADVAVPSLPDEGDGAVGMVDSYSFWLGTLGTLLAGVAALGVW